MVLMPAGAGAGPDVVDPHEMVAQEMWMGRGLEMGLNRDERHGKKVIKME